MAATTTLASEIMSGLIFARPSASASLPAQPAPRVFSGRRFSAAGGFFRERLAAVFFGVFVMRPAGRG